MAWIQDGNIYRKTNNNSIIDNIEKGVYYVKKDGYGFFLEKTNEFKLPSKIYGNTNIVSRWLTSYNNSDKNTGVLLSGLKGSGKTLLSKKLAMDSNLPIIILDTPYSGTDFVSFITSKDFTNVCFFIDEFDKSFALNQEAMTSLLSILDGASSTHNLFIFTCNDIPKNEIYQYLVNRPSRIKYKSDYISLDIDVIEEVIEDLLDNKEHKQDLLYVCEAIGQVSFDTLISIIQEMNLFKESATTCVKYMNLSKENKLYTIEELWKGVWHDIDTVSCNLHSTFIINRHFPSIKDPEYEDEDYCKDEDYNGLPSIISITPDKITKLDNNVWKCKSECGVFRITPFIESNYLF